MGIVEFLEARIAEDEAVARGVASDGEWTSGSTYGMFVSIEARSWTVVSGEWERRDANHIARHDPARVLREVAAKRAVITQSREANEYYAHMSGNGRIASMAAGNVNACAAMLKALASVYDDHPDFSEEWRS
ncbi:DUF6221 family protein [Rhodococcus qingshengii]|uniref:DUF6221 family protein n=1 Tax=Rhodococcus qingshengii TaxID=334542 RepID=UPI0021FFF6B3|nr:DUF6221 family protein [Rhodococcus qingshengii]BDQ19744.1 DUF6221 family protein [Rhodococcus qingshengii]